MFTRDLYPRVATREIYTYSKSRPSQKTQGSFGMRIDPFFMAKQSRQMTSLSRKTIMVNTLKTTQV